MITDLRSLARALGGEVSGRQALAPGPGHSQRDRSLSIRIEPGAPDGFVVHSFAGDDPLVCKDHVRSRLGLPSWEPGDEQDRWIDPARVRTFDRAAIDQEARKRTRTDDDLLRIERAVAIWNDAQDPCGTLAQVYLNDHRKLNLEDDLAGSVLRFHPRTPWRDENAGRTVFIPALIAAFRSIDDGTITAIHRIRLDQSEAWPKTQRRMLGIVHRAAIMFDAIGPSLAIGEGVETCMAARQLGIRPTWALGSVGAISFFPLLDGIKHLSILAENDGASRNAVRLCISRWWQAWRKINVVSPDDGCSDLNDELMRARS
jgi:putative DNA primase/helicase